jgi:hypothetical protein
MPKPQRLRYVGYDREGAVRVSFLVGDPGAERDHEIIVSDDGRTILYDNVPLVAVPAALAKYLDAVHALKDSHDLALADPDVQSIVFPS